MEKINYKKQGSRVKGGKLSSYSGSPPILGGDEGVVIRRSTPPSPLSTSTPLNPLFNKEGKPIGRGVRKEGVPKAGAFDKEGKPQGREVKKLLLFLFTVLSLAAPAHALDISDYTAYPPFLPRVTSPNILFMLDYSKSMVRPAYGNCKSVSDYSDAGVVDSTTADTDVSDCRTTFNQIGVGEITLTGTIAVTNGSATITGTSTQFTTQLSAGNTIRIKNMDYTVSAIGSTTSLTLGSTYRGTTESGLMAYKVGTLIGTVSVTNGSTTVTGTGTSFSTELAEGGTIILKDVPYTISSIASDTSLTLASSYTGTTASGFSARKGDAYSKVTPYSGYFDNGYSGSGSYSDSSAYKYTCTAASNGTCAKDSLGAWNGNWLNWLTATQFDILKKVAIGGDVNPAPEQSSPGKVRSILTDGYTFRKTMALKEGDTDSDGVLDYCEGKIPDALCKKFPAMTGAAPYVNAKYSWIVTPGAGATTIFTTGDINSSEVTLPFPFTFYGNTYTKLKVGIDGIMSFTSLPTSSVAPNYYNNGNIPVSNDQDNIIAPYWDDLYIDNSRASNVKAFTTGTAPNRIFVVTYQDVSQYYDWSDNATYPDQALMTFQVLFYEGSNHIVFQYKDVDTDIAATSSSYQYVAGRSATIGVENSDGTVAKKYSYNGTLYDSTSVATALANCRADYTDAQHIGCAIFATPHLSFTVTPRSGTTDFQPAAPFDFGGSTGGYKVEININENASCTAEGVGCFYNKDRNKYYDHQTVGLLQDFRDGELGGTLGFRLGIMQLNATDGGSVVKHFNAKDTTGWSSLMNATRSQTPLTNTPLAEALYEATGYFSETESWDYGSDWTYHATSSTCAATGTNYDPYCFQSAAQRVSCCKSFILLVSSGNYSNDNKTNIYGDADDANGTINTGALKAIDGGSLTSGTTGEGTKLNGGYLDNVAYKAHTTDWRSDLEGTQNLSLYAVNTFGEGSGDGTAILKKAAKYGGFDDADGDNTYDFTDTNGNGICDTGESWEDDKDCDGDPDTYFEASGGSDLKNTIINAVMEIMKTSASGTSVSVLSTSAGGEGAIYQAYFYPARIEGTTEERTWPGFIRAFFLDEKQNLRDDSSGGSYSCSSSTDSCTYSGTPDMALVASQDKIAQMCLSTTSSAVRIKLFVDSNGDNVTDTASTSECPSITSSDDPIAVGMDDVRSIWEGGDLLALRAKSTRKIYTWVPTIVTATNGGGFTSASGTPMDFTDANKTLLSPYLRAAAGDVDGAGTTYSAFTADKEAEYIIRFIRGEAITPGTTSFDNTGVSYRNRCVSISGASQETGCTESNQRVWALGDIVYSTPTLVASPSEGYDQLYGDSDYKDLRTRYLNRRRMVYVGGNDGMLHAFNAGLYTSGDDPDNSVAGEVGSFAANSSSSLNGFVNGWDSSTEIGDELWAFIPHDNLPHLAWLACNGTSTAPGVCGTSEYTHVFYVDGRPKVTDARIFNNSDSSCGTTTSGLVDGQGGACHPGGWGTIMIMSMRLGGGAIDVDINSDSTISDNEKFRSAYYAFDITDPEKKPRLLWRFYDSNLGFTTSYPAIARMCDNDTIPCSGNEKWYMVVGNGSNNLTGTQASGIRDYGGNSTTLQGKVFVIDMTDGSLDNTITVDTTSTTYLGDPLVVDENFDFNSDVIYIGSAIQSSGSSTITGKVYRIKTNGGLASAWTGSTLFNTTKPMLIPPSVAKDTQDNLWVFFGTGRLRNSDDLSNSEQQTYYGIKDACGKSGATCTTDYTSATLVNTSSAAVNSSTQNVTGVTAPSGYSGYTGSYSSLLAMMRSDTVKGWYVNLDNPTTPSERSLSASGVLGSLVLFTTYIPVSDICSTFGDSRLYALNFETGTAYNKVIIGTTNNSTGISETGSSTSSTSGTYVSRAIGLGKGMPTKVGIAVGEKGMTGFVTGQSGEVFRVEVEPGTTIKSGAASWREKSGSGGTSGIETIYKHIGK